MQTPNDLNDGADALAALYDAMTFHTADPGLTGVNIADGGESQAVTFIGGGLAGPGEDRGAVDGMSWTDLTTWTLAETATFMGLWLGGEFRRGEKLRAPLGGPDTDAFTYSFAVGPAAKSG